MNKERGFLVVKMIVGCGSLGLIFYGQKNIGLTGTSLMLVGLSGLLVLLYTYNKKFN